MTIKIEFPADRTDIALALGKALTSIGGGCGVVTSSTVADVTFNGESVVSRNMASEPTEEPSIESHAHITPTEELTEAAGLDVEDPLHLKFYGLYPATHRAVILETRDELAEARKDPDFVLVDQVRHDRAVADWATEDHGPFYMLHHESESGEIVQTWGEAEAGIAQGCDSVTKEHYDRTMAKWQTPVTSSTSAEVDEHGTPKNPEFCATATKPFYGSGKKKGQWKKRQGVDEAAYDEWYASAKPEQETKEPEHNPDLAANTFGAPSTQADATAPADMGALMAWVAEQQTAGNITQQDVTDGFAALSMPFDGLMNENAADNIAKMYNHLKGLI